MAIPTDLKEARAFSAFALERWRKLILPESFLSWLPE